MAPTPSGMPPAGSQGMPPRSAPAKGPTPEQASKIMALEKEVAAKPGNVEAWTELGHYYFDSHQFDKAIRAYKQSLELSPYNADVWTDLGVMYRRAGKPMEAVAAFDKAIDIDPRHEVSRFNKGVVLMGELKNLDAAIATWEDLLKVNPAAKSPSGEPLKTIIEKMKERKGNE